MKTQNQIIQKGLALGFLAAALVLSVGCAKKSDGFSASETPADTTTTTPNIPRDTDGPRGSSFASGATAPLTVDSLTELNNYVATHPINNPSDVRISVSLHDGGTNQYYGDVYISYYDNGQYYTGHFVADSGSNPSSGTTFPNAKHATYNNWFTLSNQARFHGFFQDSYGAILLVADQALDQGDGAGATQVSGSIWYKNFANSQAQPNPQGIPCWFITLGPYDCRTFLVPGDGQYGSLNPTSVLYPTQSQYYTSSSTNPYIPEEPARGWKRLGTFSGLDKAKAFAQ